MFLLRGFTLIEILVVIVIVGLLAGVALPRFFSMSKSYEVAAQRESILVDIGNLGYRAYSQGKALELANPDNGVTAVPLLNLPAGWQLKAPKTIRYDFNGVCSGGQIELISPIGSIESYRLTPPLCKPTALSAKQ